MKSFKNHIQVLGAGALGWPRGMGWRGRWEGGSGCGTHVNPWLIHVNVWQKPLQYCKVISLQLIKTNGKKNHIHLLKLYLRHTLWERLCALLYCSYFLKRFCFLFSLKHNLYPVKCTYLKCTGQWIFPYAYSRETTTQIQSHFSIQMTPLFPL